jgi:2-polyprenyl-3-methyl-5-hydroxy-6-metoxy-1,4-benzoquinol methylase
MDTEMSELTWRFQAAHFDRLSPIMPAVDILRRSGFRFQYTLKDVLIKSTLDQLQIKPAEKVLDGGCGLGILLDRLGVSYSIDGFGVDVSMKSLEKAKKKGVTDLKLSRADVKALPLAGDTFDYIVSSDVLEHVMDPTVAVCEFVRVLKPGGQLVIYAVSRNNRMTFNWFLHVVLRMFGIDPDKRTGHSSELLVNPCEIQSCLEDNGCMIQDSKFFHAFFTLLFDQLLLSVFWIWSKIAEIRPAGLCINPPGSSAMAATTRLSKLFVRILTAFDRPWTTRGLSNGFLIVAAKPTKVADLGHMQRLEDA